MNIWQKQLKQENDPTEGELLIAEAVVIDGGDNCGEKLQETDLQTSNRL